VRVWSKFVSKEGHSLEAETPFRSYLASRCSTVTESSNMVFDAHALKTLQVLSKSVSKVLLGRTSFSSLYRLPSERDA
jgi:hypothetical protein